MIWLTWRQFHTRAVIAMAALIAFAVLMGITGTLLVSQFGGGSIATCQPPSDCTAAADDFLQKLMGSSALADSSVTGTGTYWLLFLLGIFTVLIVPALLGMFWGAPLIAGELEAGTHYLVWNQSITRSRWLAVKLTLIGLTAMAFTESLSLIWAWWATPISQAVASGAVATPLAMNQFSPLVFATHGITPLGYAAFAFALGITAGVLVRRAVPAMALTLAVFAVLQIAVPLWVRPGLFPADHSVSALSSFVALDVPIESGTFTVIPSGWDGHYEDWILSTRAVDAAGNPVSLLPQDCLQGQQTGKASHLPLLDCLASHGVRVALTYQPSSRYWAFQGTEAAIYIVLALTLAGFCFWRLNRRLT